MVAFFVILSILSYFFVGGIACTKIQKIGKARCKFPPRYCDGDCGHSVLAGFSVLFWPVTIPILAGMELGKLESRDERRHQKALENTRRTRELEKELGI